MKKLYFLTVCLLTAFAAMAQTAETIEGTLNIEMMGSNLAENQAATVKLIATGDNTCTFLLPDFKLDLGGGPASLGDIEVPNVKVTEADNVKTYNGGYEGLKLAEGTIDADVNLNGTVDANGDANMDIDVIWDATELNLGMVPIKVTFKGKVVAGVADIIVDENAPVEYYDLRGVRVANPENGLYIRRQGNKVTKVLVK